MFTPIINMLGLADDIINVSSLAQHKSIIGHPVVSMEFGSFMDVRSQILTTPDSSPEAKSSEEGEKRTAVTVLR